jgi:transcriptional regulator with XRE-family HTH domain
MPSARTLEVQRTIAANIRRWRSKRGLTQEKLAEKANLGAVHVRNVERGTENITIATLIAIVDALEARPADLFRAAKLPPLVPGRPRKPAARTAPVRAKK